MLLVFDVNGVLCTRVHLRKFGGAHGADGSGRRVLNSIVWKRDGVAKALERLMAGGHEIAIWSSASQLNLMATLRHLFDESLIARFQFVWGAERCTIVGDPNGRAKPLFLKDAAYILNAFGDRYERVVIVDDSREKMGTGKDGTYIVVSSWKPGSQRSLIDDLGELIDETVM